MTSPKISDVAGGYDVILLSDMPRKYKCPICTLLMRAPIQTCRGELACQSCYINATKDSNNMCPIDNEAIESHNDDIFFKDNHTRHEILQLQCYCPNKKNGCAWQGVINEIENHSTNCLYEEISCTQCHDIVYRKDMEQHETVSCRFRITHCPYCAGRYDTQSLQHWDTADCDHIDMRSYKIHAAIKEIREIDLQKIQQGHHRIERSLSEIEEFRQSNEKIKQLERGCDVLSANLSDLELKLQLLENFSYNGLQLWKVDNVMYKMNRAVTAKVTVLHSTSCFQRMGDTSYVKGKKKPKISLPAQFEHRLHIGFDRGSGEFTGMPDTLAALQMFHIVPPVVMETVKFNKPASREKKPKISLPTQFEHRLHIGFDCNSGEWTGMPDTLAALQMFHVVPPAVIDTLKFHGKSKNQNEDDKFMNFNKPTSQPTVSDLRCKHIKRLASFLDPDNGIGTNCKEFGYQIFHDDRDACEEIETMHLMPQAKEFLEGLITRNPTFTVTAFKDIAIKYKRSDISLYIESLNCPQDQHFKDLTPSQQNKIARYLAKDVRVDGDMRMFADEVGFTCDEIKQFITLHTCKIDSPTERIIELIKQKKPILKLTKVKEALSEIRRNDVVLYMDTVIEEMGTTKKTLM